MNKFIIVIVLFLFIFASLAIVISEEESELPICNEEILGQQICVNDEILAYCGGAPGSTQENMLYQWHNINCQKYCENGKCMETTYAEIIEEDIKDSKYVETFPSDKPSSEQKLFIANYKAVENGTEYIIQVWVSKDKKWCESDYKTIVIEGTSTPYGFSDLGEIPDEKVLKIKGDEIYNRVINEVFWVSYDFCVDIVEGTNLHLEVPGNKTLDIIEAYLEEYPSSCENKNCKFEKEDGDEQEEEEEEFIEQIEEGASNVSIDERVCGLIGLRENGRYCSIKSLWVDQKEGEEPCDNNFECKSNVCVADECISQSLIKKIIEWFKRLFR